MPFDWSSSYSSDLFYACLIKNYKGWNTHYFFSEIRTVLYFDIKKKYLHSCTQLSFSVKVYWHITELWVAIKESNPFLIQTDFILNNHCLTSIPVPGPMCVDSLCSAVPCAVDVFVFGAVGPPEHFAWGSDIWGVSHLFMSVVPSWMALGRVFESL